MSIRKTRIVAFADSLALPRDEPPDVIRWEETWPYLLESYLRKEHKDVEVINCGSRARTIDTLVRFDFAEHIIYKRPDIIIIQLGIVDCSPRIFSRREKILLNLKCVPQSLRKIIINRRSAKRASIIKKNPLAKVYSPPDYFNSCLEVFAQKIKELSSEVKIFVLPIVAESEIFEKKSPGHGENIKLYNRMLELFCNIGGAEWIAPLNIYHPGLKGFFCSDGYHLSPMGHAKIASYLSNKISLDL